jgi:hypothetical protein
MKIINLIILLAFSSLTNAQLPESGTYTYKYCYKEWHSCVNTCTVVIKGDSITVYSDEDQSVPKGEIIDRGFLMKHKSGKWIIGHSEKDKNAKAIGGCGIGPSVIDFGKKRFKP